MASLAREEGRLPRSIRQGRAGDLPAGPWEFDGGTSGLVFEERTGKAYLKDLGRSVAWPTTLGQFLSEKVLHSFFDDGFLVGELSVLDLSSKKLLKIVGKSDVQHGESFQPSELRIGLRDPLP
jgi:hypothetical protein